ncbi:MAG: glycosyltransferase family 2 protein [Chthoniobacterales bacterium]|nr:MAG: glycosyltransferase family 2 protein [Chthoniobacterales bacterium]
MAAHPDAVAIDRTTVAAIIPAYHEEKHIAEVVRRTLLQLDHVLVVDDGSTDATATAAQKADGDVIIHPQNRGKGESIKTGLRHWLERDFVYAVILDGDGQHLPEEISRFLAAAAASRAELLIGTRMNDVSEMPLVRRLVNRYMSGTISRLCGQQIPDTQCGFRMVHRSLIPDLLGGADRFDYETEMLILASRKGCRIESVPITTVYSDEVSSIHPVRDTIRFFKLMRRYKRKQ